MGTEVGMVDPFPLAKLVSPVTHGRSHTPRSLDPSTVRTLANQRDACHPFRQASASSFSVKTLL